MLKTWIIYSVSLIGTFIFFLCYKMWVSWYCLIFLLVLPIPAFILSLIASKTLKFTATTPGGTIIGMPANILFTVDGFASYFSTCKLSTTITDRMAGSSRTVKLTISDSGTSKIPLNTDHCGAYSYKISKVRVYDLLGFFHFDKKLNKDVEFLVKPIPQMPDYMPDMFGFKAKNLRKSKKPHSEIYDIREYQPGDPIKTIHWKMTAKKDKVLVKEPLEEYGGYSRVILEMTDDRDKLDLHLGQILFTSKFFLDHETSHVIRVIPPDSREIAFSVESTTDLEKALASILRMRIPEEARQKVSGKVKDIPSDEESEEASDED